MGFKPKNLLWEGKIMDIFWNTISNVWSYKLKIKVDASHNKQSGLEEKVLSGHPGQMHEAPHLLLTVTVIYLAEKLQTICILSSASGSTNLLYTINGTKRYFYSERRILMYNHKNTVQCSQASNKIFFTINCTLRPWITERSVRFEVGGCPHADLSESNVRSW